MSFSRKARLIANTAMVSAACLGGCPQHMQPAASMQPQAEPLMKKAPRPVVLQEVEVVGKANPLTEALRLPHVGVIGPSDVFPGLITAELRKLLRQVNPEAEVSSYGIGGQDSALILKRFRRQIVEGRNNIAIISGLTIVNEWDPKNIYKNYPNMFSIAREHSIPVIVWGPTPFGGFKKWHPRMQKSADDFDAWLRARSDITYVDVTSLGVPAYGGGPLKLKRGFDSGDGLHPGPGGCKEIARLIYEQALKPNLPD
jgi:lysophospholipase L1-like esterase